MTDTPAHEQLLARAEALRASIAGIMDSIEALEDAAGALIRLEAATGERLRIVSDAELTLRSVAIALPDEGDTLEEPAEDPEPALSHRDEWTESTDRRLRDMREGGMTWPKIGKALSRTPDACRARYRKLVEAAVAKAAAT